MLILSLPAKPAVIKCLRKHFSRILAGRRRGRAHFALGFAGIQHERDQHPNVSKHVQTCLNVSESSESIPAGPNTSKAFRKLRKTDENYEKNDFFVNFFSKFCESVRTHPNASRCIRMHPNASECIRTGPNRSEQAQKLRKTCKNLEKHCEIIAKISRKL